MSVHLLLTFLSGLVEVGSACLSLCLQLQEQPGNRVSPWAAYDIFILLNVLYAID